MANDTKYIITREDGTQYLTWQNTWTIYQLHARLFNKRASADAACAALQQTVLGEGCRVERAERVR
jgi:hypothetical protein